MGQIVMEVSGDERKILKSIRNVKQGQKDMEVGWEKVTRSSAKLNTETERVGKTTDKLGQVATRVWNQVRTPMQKYNEQMKQATVLLAHKKLTVDQYRRAQAHYRTELQKEIGVSAAAARGQALRTAKMREAEKAGQAAFGPSFLTMIRGAAAALGITGGLAGAVQLVRMEYDKFRESQQRAKEATLPLADAQRMALANLAPETAKERDSFIADIKDMSDRLGMPQQGLYIAASSALSAKGDLPTSKALEAVEAAARMAPYNAQTAQAISGAALDISKMGPGITPTEAVGFLMEGLKRSRTVDPEIFSHTAPIAMQATMQRGGTPEEGMALFAAISQGMVDAMGRRAATAAQQLTEQLAKPKDFEGAEALAAAPTLQARLDMLQSDKQLRDAFIAQSSFEGKAQATVEQMLEGGIAAKTYATFLKDLPRAAEAGPAFERAIALQSGTSLQQTAGFARGVQTTVEAVRTSDQTRARLGILHENYGSLLEDTGSSRLAARLGNLALTGTGIEGYARSLESRITQLEGPRYTTVVSPDAMGLGIGAVARLHSREETEQLTALQELARLLRELIQQNRPPALGKPGVQTTNTKDTTDR